ncbi:uncharacterized protein PRCAT00001177001 [Priceomyces carsonii]|uniref:uncharacterized protein n=1 Tax=Priceomyces carsonii TaxID=28549 RepID=UPI002EDBA96B|nr:unnamed protein product [Priceomyces carsonii]
MSKILYSIEELIAMRHSSILKLDLSQLLRQPPSQLYRSYHVSRSKKFHYREVNNGLKDAKDYSTSSRVKLEMKERNSKTFRPKKEFSSSARSQILPQVPEYRNEKTNVPLLGTHGIPETVRRLNSVSSFNVYIVPVSYSYLIAQENQIPIRFVPIPYVIGAMNFHHDENRDSGSYNYPKNARASEEGRELKKMSHEDKKRHQPASNFTDRERLHQETTNGDGVGMGIEGKLHNQYFEVNAPKARRKTKFSCDPNREPNSSNPYSLTGFFPSNLFSQGVTNSNTRQTTQKLQNSSRESTYDNESHSITGSSCDSYNIQIQIPILS